MTSADAACSKQNLQIFNKQVKSFEPLMYIDMLFIS